MNEIVNNFLLAEDKFMPEIHIKHFGFTYSAYGLFTENKERIERFLQTGNTNYIYKNDLDKAWKKMVNTWLMGKYKDLNKRTQSDKFLRDKAFKTANNLKYHCYQRRLA